MKPPGGHGDARGAAAGPALGWGKAGGGLTLRLRRCGHGGRPGGQVQGEEVGVRAGPGLKAAVLLPAWVVLFPTVHLSATGSRPGLAPKHLFLRPRAPT